MAVGWSASRCSRFGTARSSTCRAACPVVKPNVSRAAAPNSRAASREPIARELDAAGGRRLGSARRHAQSVAVGIFERALTSCEAFFVDGDAELVCDGVDVGDVEMDQGVGPGVALVF